eukprot:TRINITY_DN1428_c0_g1_i2.p1 TRINITY_DN1428_c0_g1~~TRINITY_DN1428_c0_g1_i2.p1  ORF type:complete len:976 (-),score=226.14 TRINITY_DN1428_c0_g1_i2:59-2599(-)
MNTIFDNCEPDIDSVALIQYTSGSTADPKGVQITYRNIIHNTNIIQNEYKMGKNTRMLTWIPHFHDMGLIGGLMSPLLTGGNVYIFSALDFISNPCSLLQIISKFQIDIMPVPPSCLDMIANKFLSLQPNKRPSGFNLSSMKNLLLGAQATAKQTLDRFHSCFASYGLSPTAIKTCYGMAEHTLIISSSKAEPPRARLYRQLLEAERRAVFVEDISVLQSDCIDILATGDVLNGIKVRIVDESFNCVEDGSVGEVMIQSQSVSKGYWQNESATKQTFRNQIKNEDGNWLKSGDLGFFMNDHLYLCGRIKEQIIIGGRNIYPEDIETAAKVADSIVLRHGGIVAFSDGSMGELSNEQIVVLCEVRPECSDYEELCRKIRHCILSQCCVMAHRIILVPARAVPKTTSGKCQRLRFKQALMDGTISIIYESIEFDEVTDASLPAVSSPTLMRESLLVAVRTRLSMSEELMNTMMNSGATLHQMGVDSVSMIRLHSDFCDITKTAVSLPRMFDLSLSDVISKLTSGVTLVDLTNRTIHDEAEAEIANMISQFKVDDHMLVRHTKKPKNPVQVTIEDRNLAIVTGATGYVGIWSAYGFLKSVGENGKKWNVYCVVRGNDGEDRVWKNFEHFFLKLTEEEKSRLFVLKGDVERDWFGVNLDIWRNLRDEYQNGIKTLVHCAAIDNFIYTYEMMKSANVIGTLNALRLTRLLEGRMIYTSSVIVSLAEQYETHFNRPAILSSSHGLYNGYCQSKYVAERMVLKATNLEYVCACSCRFAYLYDRSETTIDVTDSLEHIIEICARMGAIFDQPGLQMDLTPVEYAVDIIMALSVIDTLPPTGQVNIQFDDKQRKA